MPENGDKHQETVALPSLASALPQHFPMKLPLLSSEPGGFHFSKKSKGAEGQRYDNGCFPAANAPLLRLQPRHKADFRLQETADPPA
tara:strand:+ start:12760 stop:13020 length:261 start_codon:yes stop_codon:yes gene_type:complete